MSDPNENEDPFLSLLRRLDRDGLLGDCNAALAQSVQRVLALGGTAKLVLTVTLSRRGHNQITAEGKLDEKLPKPAAVPVTFFATSAGTLSADDPSQPEFAAIIDVQKQRASN